MNNHDKSLSFLFSWPVIVIAFIFCWPIGLVLLIKRFSSDRTAVMRSGAAILRIVGIVMICFGVLGLFGSMPDVEPFDIAMVAFFIAGGVVLMRKSVKMKAEGNEIKKYLSIIVNHSVREIGSIASAMGKTEEKTMDDIQNLIDRGYLKNAYIDLRIGQIVLASDSVNNSAVAQAQAQAREDLRPRVVTCKCCGANNTVVGPVGKCEYCDSPIQ